MANKEHLKILKLGVIAWNQWRWQNPKIQPDLNAADLNNANLSEANLSEAKLNQATISRANLYCANLSNASLVGAGLTWSDLSKANLRGTDLQNAVLRRANLGDANLSKAKLMGANLRKADLQRAILTGADLTGALLSEVNLTEATLTEATLDKANLYWANLYKANLSGAKLMRANLRGANLHRANLIDANLSGAELQHAILVETKLKMVNLTGCSIYGIAVWNLKGTPKEQSNLIITRFDEPTITVDNLEVAQFIYFLITNKKIRDVINTVANKAVLILGRFTKERKEVLDAIADKLRSMDLVPIMFDFEKPEEQDIIETVTTLAGISKFIIADVTAAKVIPDELRSFVPDFAVPVVPLFQPSKEEPKAYTSLYTLYKKYHWVFEPVEYTSKEHLLEILPEQVIKPAEAKRLQLNDMK